MSFRIYLMPTVTTGTSPRFSVDPKYKSEFDGTAIEMMVYGIEPVCLVLVENISSGANTTVSGHADVTALPVDLTQTIGAQLTTVQNILAGLNIPENWVQSTHTYLQVLRVVVQVFMFMQNLVRALPNARLFAGSITLASRINQLPGGVTGTAATALKNTAISLGYDVSGLTGTTTLRQALKAMADQSSNIEVPFGPQTF